MAKRKAKRNAENQASEELPDAPPPKGEKRKNDDSDSDEDMDELQVDLEFFDPQEIDFHGLKTLMRQLLDIDNQLFDLSALSDLILSQPLLGSTVKTDGNESDPYAILTVLNMKTHEDKPVIRSFKDYLSRNAAKTEKLKDLPALLSSTDAQVGLVLSERFINMPFEIVPSMYNMLLEEITWALEEKEPYEFTHYLILSKTYQEVTSQLPGDSQPPSKKAKGGGKGAPETFYFHAEDEVLQKHSLGWGNFDYETPADEGASDSKRAFQEMGIKPMGHMVLIEAAKFKDAVEALTSFLSGGQ